jgi:hypothetical protein
MVKKPSADLVRQMRELAAEIAEAKARRVDRETRDR